MNRDTAKAVIELYNRLSKIDRELQAMRTKPVYGETPLQKVTFYLCAGGYSGPADYEPRHNALAIASCIITDMEIVRAEIVRQIEALGFDVEQAGEGK